MKVRKIQVKAVFTEEVLGTAPQNRELYRTYIASKSEDAKKIEEEVNSLGVEAVLDKTRTGFSMDEDGEPHLWDYQIKGFFKDACGGLRKMTGSQSEKLKAYKKIIDKDVFITPRKIRFENVVDIGSCERPLRTSGPQGERTALAISDTVNAGSYICFSVFVLDGSAVKAVREWLDYGTVSGLGQWRNSGKGTFRAEIIADEDIEIESFAELLA